MAGRSLTALWWWIDRWRKSTAYTDMSLTEQGAYRNLLDEGWLRGGPLPADEEVLAKACGDPRVWPQVRSKILPHFYTSPEGWRNATLEAVLAESQRRARKQRHYYHGHRGHKSGNNHGNKPGNTSGNNVGNNPGNKSQSPDPSPDPSPSLDPEPAVQVLQRAGAVPVVGAEPNLGSPPASPAVLDFATVGPETRWALTDAHLASWREAYPSLDVASECRRAKAWLEAQPDRRKTARGMPRFLVSWLNRAIDRRGAPLHAGPPAPTVGAINAAYVARRRGQQS